MHAYIKGIASFLPENIEYNDSGSRLTKKTGIYVKHIAARDECASDMAVQATEKLFEKYGYDRSLVDFIILCTQSPDYILPTTACVLQHRLGLSTNCGAFDFNLGCSGYIYGLSIAKGLIESRQAQNVLLLTAETYSKWIHPEDGTVRPIFGDGATATLISGDNVDDEGMQAFQFGTNGSGADNLIVTVGGVRNPVSSTPSELLEDESGNRRTNYHLYMNGNAISQFAMEVVPSTLELILQQTGLTREEVDYYVFHQANKFMLNFLRQKCGLQDLPFWNKPDYCGNTVSNSIPLALEEILQIENIRKLEKVLCIGFGVGLSWAGCLIDLSKALQKMC